MANLSYFSFENMCHRKNYLHRTPLKKIVFRFIYICICLRYKKKTYCLQSKTEFPPTIACCIRFLKICKHFIYSNWNWKVAQENDQSICSIINLSATFQVRVRLLQNFAKLNLATCIISWWLKIDWRKKIQMWVSWGWKIFGWWQWLMMMIITEQHPCFQALQWNFGKKKNRNMSNNGGQNIFLGFCIEHRP